MIDPAVTTGVADLEGRYTDAVNRWDVDALRDCFTVDATWEVVGVPKSRGDGREGTII